MINDEVHEIIESVKTFNPLEPEKVVEASAEIAKKVDDLTCPICGEEMHRSGRCTTCYTCGWSTCSI
jgi:predicted ATP-grasp superfamily ATP-dependent carboligase